MPKRRFVWNPELKTLVEVDPDYEQVSRQDGVGSLWNDRSYDGLRATDGSDISSRSKHRSYMKRNGLTTADDYKGEWSNAEKRRDAYRTVGKGGATSREDVGRAIHQLESAQRRRK